MSRSPEYCLRYRSSARNDEVGITADDVSVLHGREGNILRSFSDRGNELRIVKFEIFTPGCGEV